MKTSNNQKIEFIGRDGKTCAFRLLNPHTQRAQDMQSRYKYHNYGGVCDFYKQPSTAKTRAEIKIVNFMRDVVGGYGYHVTGGNTSTFSAGWLFDRDGKTYLVYETAQHHYCMEYDKTRGAL